MGSNVVIDVAMWCLPSGEVNSYDPTMSITLLFGLSSVGGASFNVPVSSRFCPSDVSYLIVFKRLINYFSITFFLVCCFVDCA